MQLIKATRYRLQTSSRAWSSERRLVAKLDADARQIWENRLGQILHSQPAVDRKRGYLNAVGPLGRQQVRAEKLPRAAIGYQFDEASRIARRERARHVIE